MATALNHTPATPLPWEQANSPGYLIIGATGKRIGETEYQGNAAYIAHAANAYPKLVEQMRFLLGALDAPTDRHGTLKFAPAAIAEATALLRELGEAT